MVVAPLAEGLLMTAEGLRHRQKIFRKLVFCQLRKNKRKAGNCVNGLIAFCYLKKVYRYYGPGKQRLGTNTYILTYVPIHWGKGF